jgi:hypothetical protein
MKKNKNIFHGNGYTCNINPCDRSFSRTMRGQTLLYGGFILTLWGRQLGFTVGKSENDLRFFVCYGHHRETVSSFQQLHVLEFGSILS